MQKSNTEQKADPNSNYSNAREGSLCEIDGGLARRLCPCWTCNRVSSRLHFWVVIFKGRRQEALVLVVESFPPGIRILVPLDLVNRFVFRVILRAAGTLW